CWNWVAFDDGFTSYGWERDCDGV
ncbi:hypothetical protein A2U01_0097321, partial [Trifolium medium]|nr:hypothetical protein [Trifolium medium]